MLPVSYAPFKQPFHLEAIELHKLANYVIYIGFAETIEGGKSVDKYNMRKHKHFILCSSIPSILLGVSFSFDKKIPLTSNCFTSNYIKCDHCIYRNIGVNVHFSKCVFFA